MSVFGWLKKLFKKETLAPSKEDDFQLPGVRIKIRQDTAKPPEQKKEIPKEKVIPKTKEIHMDDKFINAIWLIVVDTTGMDKKTFSYNESTGERDEGGGENDPRKLGPLGIKTFAFVTAPDINAAKGVFWRTIGARNPATRRFMPEIARATKATNFSQIFPILARGMGVCWNYVGSASESLPGQQSAINQRAELVGKNPYGDVSAREYQPAAPQIPDGIETKVNPNEVGSVSAEDKKVLQSGIKTPQMPQMPMGNMNQQQMMQMMQMMMQMMQGGMQPQQPPPQATFTEQSQNISSLSADDIAAIESNKTPLSQPETDPELEKQIAEIKSKGGHNPDLSSLNEDIDPEELDRMAKMTQAINPRSDDAPVQKKGKRVRNNEE
jgi:hypothetical protein